jgi:epoxyqueuosine reductase
MRVNVGPLAQVLAREGLPLMGWVPAATWDAQARPGTETAALLPGGAGLLVVGAAGGGLWESFVQALEEDPARLTQHAHPLDAHAQRVIARADALLGDLPRRWMPCAAEAPVHLDFRTLGWRAGLGLPSRLGLLLHPAWGPWIALRAACVLTEAPEGLPMTHALDPQAPSPCEACVSAHGTPPCARACPGGAFPQGRWDVEACASFHAPSPEGGPSPCRASCAARLACPLGAEHRYPPEALAYHYDRFEGRRALRARLGLPHTADPFEGDGPHWGGWRDRFPTPRRA